METFSHEFIDLEQYAGLNYKDAYILFRYLKDWLRQYHPPDCIGCLTCRD